MQRSSELATTGWSAPPIARALTLDRAAVALAVMVGAAILSRFWELGVRALHHDESLHALFAFRLYAEGSYHHDPLMHGPVLFHLTAFAYWLLGASDATSRFFPALIGVALVGLPWLFRDWLGRGGALFASLMILVSPTLLYYSRFIRHDIFLALWTVVILYGLWRYLQRGEAFHLYLMAAGWGLALSTKEVSYILAAVFWSFLALVVLARWQGRLGPRVALREMREWHLVVTIGALMLPHTAAFLIHLFGLDPVGGYNEVAYTSTSFILRAGAIVVGLLLLGIAAAGALWDLRRFLIASAIFYTIFALFHTTLLSWPFGIASGMVGSLGYWIEQHDVKRGDQPWYYYSMLLPLYEFLPLALGAVGGWRLLRGRGEPVARPKEAHLDTRALWPYFNLWWLVVLFVGLSIAGEKMPWLLTHIALPVALLAGWSLDRLLTGIEPGALIAPRALLHALLVAIALLAGVELARLIFTSAWPFGGGAVEALATSARWLGSALLLALALWGIGRLREDIPPATRRHSAILVAVTLATLATVRFAVIGAFRNADLANEPLIYTQTSPDVPMVMGEIEAMSVRLTGGRDLRIAYDSETSWPFEWYLRDYPNKFFYSNSPEAWPEQVQEASVVLVGLNQEEKVRPLMDGFIRHHYSMRPNFPEDYKKLMTVYQGDPPAAVGTSRSPLTIASNLWRAARPAEARRDFVDFLWNRRIEQPLGRFDFVMYVKSDVAVSDWAYGAQVAAIDPTLARDPFREVAVDLAPVARLDAGGTLATPRDMAPLADGALAALDSGNARVLLLDAAGQPGSSFGVAGSDEGQFNDPWGVATAPDGSIYVADTWNHRVQRFSRDGEFLGMWGTFLQHGEGAGGEAGFYGPRGIAVDAEGYVYVADTGNGRIQKFDPDGTFVAQSAGLGSGPGQLREPVGIAIAPDGTIAVADTWNRRVQRFTSDLEPLNSFPVGTWRGTDITNKPYIAAGDDRIWVTDPDRGRIIEFAADGTMLRVWGGLQRPYGLRVSDGILWVAESEGNRLSGYAVEE